MSQGDFAGAAAAAAGCRAAWPGAAAGWLLGSIAALMADDKKTALALVEARLAADGRDVQCLLQKAECLLALGDRAAALEAAEGAAAHAGELLVALDGVGEFLFHAGEYRSALAIYDRAVAAAPTDAVVRAKRADILRVLGHLAAAARDYRTALQLSPGAPKALKALLELDPQSADVTVSDLETALAAAAPGSSDAAILHFALAKSLETLGDHERSWQHLVAANRIERARIDYDPRTDAAFLERIIAGFKFQDEQSEGGSGERPIFIVGIPRTGSTLVERIIGSHSQVHSAGEIAAFAEAIDATMARRGGPRPADMRAFADALATLEAGQIAAEYLWRVREHRGDAPRFTDKMLTNFFHCGLIFRAFPQASIVHVTRHPLAACHAIYKTRFVGTYPFAYDLEEIGEFYLGYRRLMEHWHRLYPGRILDVAYEDVVMDLEPTTRRMLDYIGLPFEAGCLNFKDNPTPVKTTSSVQVRKPLYDSSLHAWRHHAAHLAALGKRLQTAGIDCE